MIFWVLRSQFSGLNTFTLFPIHRTGTWDLGSHSILHPKTRQLLKDKFICTHAEELCDDAGLSLELGTLSGYGTGIGTEAEATVRQVLSIMQTHTQMADKWNGWRGSGL
uniref:LD11736p n=1 Tax=Drosophila melanogaster TaxID=7227 RepID=Q86MQ8_DROME|nr:LD11736p [Drosophila melanogaster]